MKVLDKQSDKRKAILEASLNLFCEKCFQETSTASISQAANVGTGTLFCYFENKEELVNVLYLESKEEFAAHAETGVWEQTSFKTRLRQVFNNTMQWYQENPRKIKFMSQFCSSSLITKVTREKALTRQRIITEVIKKAVEDGEVSTPSVELTSSLIAGYTHIAGTYLLDNAKEKDMKAWQDAAFSLIWKGIS
jgi:AcrR family transcriptional regulator